MLRILCCFLAVTPGLFAQNDLAEKFIEDNLSTDLHILLPLDETTGDPQDTSGNNLDGTLEGGATLGADPVVDEVLNSSAAAVQIDEGDFIEVVDPTRIGCGDFSIAMWVQLDIDLTDSEGYNLPGTDIWSAGLFRKGNGMAGTIRYDVSEDDFTIAMTLFHPPSGGGLCDGSSGSLGEDEIFARVILPSSQFDPMEEHLYVFTYDQSEGMAFAWVDFQAYDDDMVNDHGFFTQTPNEWRFGTGDPGMVNSEAQGQIDLIAVWTRPLTTTEIHDLADIGHEGVDFIRGDTNADGVLNIADVSNIANYVTAGTFSPDCIEALDANDDGQVDIADSSYLSSYLFGTPPGPAPGAPTSCGREAGIDQDDDTCLAETNCN